MPLTLSGTFDLLPLFIVFCLLIFSSIFSSPCPQFTSPSFTLSYQLFSFPSFPVCLHLFLFALLSMLFFFLISPSVISYPLFSVQILLQHTYTGLFSPFIPFFSPYDIFSPHPRPSFFFFPLSPIFFLSFSLSASFQSSCLAPLYILSFTLILLLLLCLSYSSSSNLPLSPLPLLFLSFYPSPLPSVPVYSVHRFFSFFLFFFSSPLPSVPSLPSSNSPHTWAHQEVTL